MALLNPLYSLVLPFFFIFTVPFAIFAGITTCLAFCILLLRVVLIYVELAFAVISYYLLGKTSPNPLPRAHSLSTVGPLRRKKRRSSASSSLSATGTITPVASEVNLGLSQSIGATRDFEGVGGWRLDNPSDDDALWTNINSRLELPAEQHVRRHRRSFTSGSVPGDTRPNRSYSPEAVMNSSRARTPPTVLVEFGVDGYFQQPTSPRNLKRTASVITGASGSSGSSKGSSALSIKSR